MKKLFILLALLVGAPAFSQTTLTAPEVLGCSNPAPAVPPATTIFISSCKTEAFFPTTTTSIVASVSKAAPVWAHSFGGYLSVAPTSLVIACPINAIVSSDLTKCTDSTGADASALVPANAVATFTIAAPVVPPPPPPVLVNITVTLEGSPSVTWMQAPAGSCFSITDGTHASQVCAPTK